jgi:pimeloyl-ACP methyl ester carboxylesterase
VRSTFAHNGEVAVHVLDNGGDGHATPPLLVIGGLWEPAERALPLLSGLPGRVVAPSLRGRGLSSTPATGYDLEEHLSDVAAAVAHCGLTGYCVLGFSRGASYALGWSLLHHDEMAGLILVDQPPEHQRPTPGYVEFWSRFVYLGVPVLNFMRRSALEGLAREARQIDFVSRLPDLRIPVSIFAGRNRAAAIPSDLTDAALQAYAAALPACEVVEFARSGHMIPDEEQAKYVDSVAAFLGRCAPRP